jgi:hypothetical protein
MKLQSIVSVLFLSGALATLYLCGQAEVTMATSPHARVAPEGWGGLKGRVVFGGEQVPEPTAANVNKDQDICGKHAIVSDELVVNKKNRGIRWAVIWAQKPAAIHSDLAKVPEDPVELTNEDCMFKPHLVVVREGMRLRLTSADPIQHNSNIQGFKNQVNPLLPAGSKQKKSELISDPLVAESRPVPVNCNIHGWMKAWVVVLDHPYGAVTNENGEFEIKNLPAGNLTLNIWQEKFGWHGGKRGSKEVTIEPGKTTDLGELKFGM